jgi:16S rRNA (cytosine1402-N4)-methyltransferase
MAERESVRHDPVMCAEVIEALAPRSGGVYADATVGDAGHACAILDASAPDGRVVAVDRDPVAVARARERLAAYGARAVVVHGDYKDLDAILARAGSPRVQGLVADLGVSSMQLGDPARGFSFATKGPLDMRMDTTRGETAAELLARLDEPAIADLVHRYGEERRARAIARRIVEARDAGELASTEDLRRAVVRAKGPGRGRIDPATLTFQALRIAVNDELGHVEALLALLADVLDDGAAAAILSFHSLEDRLVKQRFAADPALDRVTKKPRFASDDECRRNRRARSAKLRVARRRPRLSVTEPVS